MRIAGLSGLVFAPVPKLSGRLVHRGYLFVLGVKKKIGYENRLQQTKARGVSCHETPSLQIHYEVQNFYNQNSRQIHQRQHRKKALKQVTASFVFTFVQF